MGCKNGFLSRTDLDLNGLGLFYSNSSGLKVERKGVFPRAAVRRRSRCTWGSGFKGESGGWIFPPRSFINIAANTQRCSV